MRREGRAAEKDARVRRAAHSEHYMFWQLERRPHITYKRIPHKHTQATFHVSYHAAGRDDKECCHDPMRCSRRMPTTSQRPAWVQHMAPMTNRRQSVRWGWGGGTSVALGSAWPGRMDCPCAGWAKTAEIAVRAVRVLVNSWVAATHSLRSHSHPVSIVAGAPPAQLTSLKTGYWPPKTSDELVRPREPIGHPYRQGNVGALCHQ